MELLSSYDCPEGQGAVWLMNVVRRGTFVKIPRYRSAGQACEIDPLRRRYTRKLDRCYDSSRAHRG
jgi:hypothetical protein